MTRLIALTTWLVGATALPVAAQPQEWRILDNSFLVEEAFNQERGVFQNILTWTRVRSREWVGTFTQEWPVPGTRHQFSYTIPFSQVGDVGGFDDCFVNYRIQILGGENGALALAPRISVTLPTGSATKQLGAGKAGLQVNIPASRQFGSLYVHGNGGITWIPDIQNMVTVAGSGIWQATPMFHLMLEAVAQMAQDDDSFTLSPGFRRGWGDEKQFVIGLALPVTWSGARSETAFLTYLSYELPFRKLH